MENKDREEFNNNKEKRGKAGNTRNKYKRYKYARTQELYNKNPGLLAKNIRNNINWMDSNNVKPTAEDVVRTFERTWGEAPQIRQPFSGEVPEGVESRDLDDIIPVFTTKEIKARILRMKRNTAAGPDGITRAKVTRPEVQEILRLFYSLITACSLQPQQWNEHRTTLLLKEGKDPARAENYRPVTIGSILSRLYWGLIDMKLRAQTSFTPRQKGFVSEAGCFNDVHILNEIMKLAKTRTGLVAIQLDISKAFDMIPHQAINDALTRKGIPKYVANMISRSYNGIQTVITGGTEEVQIKIRRGVKQGDPLSPFIFNALLEPLILELEEMKGFQVKEGCTIATLAFADDIILLAPNEEKAKALLQKTEQYLADLNMKISTPKCSTFQINATRDSWYLTDPAIQSRDGDMIPYADAGTHIKYLGGRISPWKGLITEGLEDDFRNTLERIVHINLKPHQKARLLSQYIVPQFIYTMVLGMIPITTVRKLDQEVRRVMKIILHLPQCTSNGLIYGKKSDGGLGIPKLETILVSASLKAGLKFMESDDPVMKAVCEESQLESRMKAIAQGARIEWPIRTRVTIDRYKSREKKKELNRWASQISQGKAVNAFKESKIANAWLMKPDILRPSKYITALKMRANVTADKASLNRIKKDGEINCRKCQVLKETLGHILGQCTYTKIERIARHDEVKDFILKRIVESDKEAIVTREPSLRSPDGGNLKPDLVVKNQEGVFVVDVTIRHEDGANLQMGRRSKMDKYTPLLPDLRERYGVVNGEVLPIVVGTRGALPRQTIAALDKLGIHGRNDLLTISLMSLRRSIELYNNFMEYNAPLRGVRDWRRE
jgi:hypothetical protein